MKNTDYLYKGFEAKSVISTPIIRKPKDLLESTDVLTIVANPIAYAYGYRGTTIEFILLPNQNGDLKRVYCSWFNRLDPTSTIEDSVSQCTTVSEFLAKNVGKKFTVACAIGDKLDNGIRPKTYTMDWC